MITIEPLKGIAYQTDRSLTINYNREYYEKVLKNSQSKIADEITQFRVDIVKKYCNDDIIDVGCGTNRFVEEIIKDRDIYQAWGYDINPFTVQALINGGLYSDRYYNVLDKTESFKAYCFWDSLEHFQEPKDILNNIQEGSYVFISIPIFQDLSDIKDSKHYRPYEHYWYFTRQGLIRYMKELKFKLLEISDQESQIGRESIETFVFRKEKEKVLYDWNNCDDNYE
jgi:hypothetical protein